MWQPAPSTQLTNSLRSSLAFSNSQHTTNLLEPLQDVVAKRTGTVLRSDTIVKADSYVPYGYEPVPEDVIIQVSGAPNFRKQSCGPRNLYGVGQPTFFGMKGILQYVTKLNFETDVHWINLREEPTIYINARPFVLREAEHPLRNLAVYSGATDAIIDNMESRIKQDLLEEANANSDMVVIHIETKDGHVIPCWEMITDANSIMTTSEIFTLLQSKYPISYTRIPITPEGPVRKPTIENFIEVFKKIPSGSCIIFNCQLGLGRSTSGIVLASLYYQSTKSIKGQQQYLTHSSSEEDSLFPFKRGEYEPVFSVLRTFENGKHVKQQVDSKIDESGLLVNLRDMIFRLATKSNLLSGDTTVSVDNVALRKAGSHLERYISFILFEAYINEQAPEYQKSYSLWLKDRPEIITIMAELREKPEDHFTLTTIASSLELASISRVRKGEVLSTKSILKADHLPSMSSLDPTGFRTVDNLFLLGAPTVDGLLDSIKLVQQTNPNQRYVWLNLREEITIFVNRKPYVLRRAAKPMKNIGSYMGITGTTLQTMEMRLKRDILEEAKQFDGRILTHGETLNLEIVTEWVTVDSVQTMEEVFAEICAENPAWAYHRVPVTPDQTPELKDFDEILEILDAQTQPTIYGLQDQWGTGRSTTAAICVYLYQMWKTSPPATIKVEAQRDFSLVNSVIRLLNHGQMIKMYVDLAIQHLSQNGTDLKDSIFTFLERAELARSHIDSKAATQKACQYLERYFWLIVLNSYLYEKSNNGFTETFSQWATQRQEFSTLIAELRTHPTKSLKYIEVLPENASDVASVINNRTGNVLGRGTILKSDHFPGCQRKGMEVMVDQAPNYRKVSGMEVYGVAIPTVEGICNVLDLLDSGIEGNSWVTWVSLREEPVSYAIGRPFVCRDSSRPFENLEHTGISTVRVENMEDEIVKDLIAEADRYNGYVLLHDEIGGVLTGEWAPVWNSHEGGKHDECDLKSCRTVYSMLAKQGYKVDFHRICITDEQSPQVSEFVELENLIWKLPCDHKMIFNCQMGRGRTTTGMVVSCLIRRWKSGTQLTPEAAREATEQRLSQTLGSFQYKTINRLIRTLENGVQAQAEADHVIDLCNAMQNLRDAVGQLIQTTAESPDPEFVIHRAQNYLRRYFFLVLFTSYLMEQPIPGEGESLCGFDAWVEKNKFIMSILDSLTLELVQ